MGSREGRTIYEEGLGNSGTYLILGHRRFGFGSLAAFRRLIIIGNRCKSTRRPGEKIKRYAWYRHSNRFARSSNKSRSRFSDFIASQAFSALEVSALNMATTISAIPFAWSLPPWFETSRQQQK
jgi:hypothetical protein